VRAGAAASRDDARSCLRTAINGFGKAQMPMELAFARLQLADVLADTEPDVARAEARTALEAFTRLDAPRLVDAAAAVLRRLGVRAVAARRSDGVLTKREAEVLDLLGTGLSNPQIATRLYISRKTVEHHVGNILAKLGLRSRAEAAVHAARENKPPNR
jgi:DNA-binding NarL/FixJ family response regulator